MIRRKTYLRGRAPEPTLILNPMSILGVVIVCGVVLGLYAQLIGFEHRVASVEKSVHTATDRLGSYERNKLGPSLALCARTIQAAHTALLECKQTSSAVRRDTTNLAVLARSWDTKWKGWTPRRKWSHKGFRRMIMEPCHE